MRDYVMEIDTTELFNSAFKKTYNAQEQNGSSVKLPDGNEIAKKYA